MTSRAVTQIDNFNVLYNVIRERFAVYFDMIDDNTSAVERENILKSAYNSVTLAIDVDDTYLQNTDTLELILDGQPDTKVRGATCVVNGSRFTLTAPDNVTVLNDLRAKGVNIVFVTSRGQNQQLETSAQISVFGYENPTVYCTDRTEKGPYLKRVLPSLNGGILIAIDDLDDMLNTYVTASAYDASRVVLLKFMPF